MIAITLRVFEDYGRGGELRVTHHELELPEEVEEELHKFLLGEDQADRPITSLETLCAAAALAGIDLKVVHLADGEYLRDCEEQLAADRADRT